MEVDLNTPATSEQEQVRKGGLPPLSETHHRAKPGQAAVWQARLIMLVMINIAQLWILAATVDAALARHYSVLLPLVVASGVCFVITLSIIKWWRPTSRKKTSSGYLRDDG
jgi:hypothetical protein